MLEALRATKKSMFHENNPNSFSFKDYLTLTGANSRLMQMEEHFYNVRLKRAKRKKKGKKKGPELNNNNNNSSKRIRAR